MRKKCEAVEMGINSLLVNGSLRVFRTSEAETPFLSGIGEQQEPSGFRCGLEIVTGSYVAAKFKKEWYLGVVVDFDQENDDFFIKFMAPKGSAINHYFSWPSPREDVCWVPRPNILNIIKTLSTSQTGRNYIISDEERSDITSIHNQSLDKSTK